jgi:hypothetical protein
LPSINDNERYEDRRNNTELKREEATLAEAKTNKESDP